MKLTYMYEAVSISLEPGMRAIWESSPGAILETGGIGLTASTPWDTQIFNPRLYSRLSVHHSGSLGDFYENAGLGGEES